MVVVITKKWMQWMSRYVHDGINLSKAIAVVAAKRRTTQPQQQQQVASELLKSVLLEQSRHGPRPNKLAISILRIEQAYGLMKYMGFMEYTKQQIIPNIIRSTSSSNSNSNSNSNGNSISTNHDHDSNNKIKNNYQNKNTVAKIAFMVTSSMKRDLMDGLNYDENEIKKMTPKRASWVLHHRIDPTVYDAQISILEEEEEREEEQQRKILEQQQQQVQQEQIKEEQQQSKQQQQDLTKDIPTTISYNNSGSEKDDKVILQLQSSQRCNKTDEDNDNNRDIDDIDELSIGAQKESALSSSSSPSLDRMANTSDNDSTITRRDGWYELVEVMKPSESETTTTPTNNHNNNDDDNHGDQKSDADAIVVCRHGLYRTKKEAMIGLETRELIHNRNQKHHHREHIAETSEHNDDDNDKNSNSFLKKPKTTTTFFVRPISDEEIRR